MPSTVIRSFKHHPERAELEVLFTTGRRYLYFNVPEEAAERFRSSFAKGIHFNRHIRGRYACRELDPERDETSSDVISR
jgi:hypothetical protein